MRTTLEDFRVSEIVNLNGVSETGGPSYLPLYFVEKRGIDTFHMARRLSTYLKSRVSFGGVKDKRAVARQYVTPTSTRCARPRVVEESCFRAEIVGYLLGPLNRGMIKGNSFIITLREACDSVQKAVDEAYRACRERRLPNFFGLQRFGVRDPLTHRVGRALILSRFEEAFTQLVCSPRTGEDPQVREAREMAATGEYARALKALSRAQDLERMALMALVRRRDDFLGAFRALPVPIRRFFVHAYQSYLFNITLSRAVSQSLDISAAISGDNWGRLQPDGLSLSEVNGSKEEPEGDALPLIQLVGYAYRDYGSRFDALISEVLREEGITPSAFYVRKAQEMSAEGGFRRAPLTADALTSTYSGDTVTLSFSLSKGEYATTLLREVMKPMDPISTGF